MGLKAEAEQNTGRHKKQQQFSASILPSLFMASISI